jgi:hypothetical protein
MNVRSIFKQLIGGRTGRGQGMSASVPGPGIPGDLVDLARMSHSATQGDIVFEPTIPRNGISTDDFDKETGQFYPDFLARRKARTEAEAAKRAEPVLAGVVKHDVYPRD